MGSLAEMALQHARQRLAGGGAPRKMAKATAAPAPAIKPKSAGLVITVPTNHFMFLEGRAWAIDMVASLRSADVEVVIKRLTGAAIGRPGSYAAGVNSVIEQLREATNEART